MLDLHSSEFQTHLLRERYRMLSQQVPLLHVIIIISVLPLCLAFYHQLHWIYSTLFPVISLIFCGGRIRFWVKLRATVYEAPIASVERVMRQTEKIAPLHSLILAVVSFAAIRNLSIYEQALCMLIVWIGAVASSFCMFALPVAASRLVTIAAMIVMLSLVLTGDTLLIITGVLLGLISWVMVYMMRSIYAAFVETVLARARMQDEQKRTAAARDEATRLANSDFLTGLANRRWFMEQLTAHVAAGSPNPYAVALLDLNGFKPINDTYGHAAGDAVLVEIGARLQRLMEGRGIAARLGGDEFALIVDGITTEREAMAFGHDVHDAIKAPFAFEGHVLALGAGCGLSLSSQSPSDADNLLHYADMALYLCKGPSRSRAAVYRTETPAADVKVGTAA